MQAQAATHVQPRLTKTCSDCLMSFPADLENFARKGSGLSCRCRECGRKLDRANYRADPYKKRDQVARWRAANPESLKKIGARHYLKNREKKISQASDWAARNPEKRRKYMRDLHQRRMREDPKYRVKRSVGAYVRLLIKSGKKSARLESILGYSISELVAHLERQFMDGMDWGNYGKWHIDHIIPVASFSYESYDSQEFKRCWALPNLRPLWGDENRRKSNKAVFLV